MTAAAPPLVRGVTGEIAVRLAYVLLHDKLVTGKI
jgi:hypothetical protein